jgi:hypothetical protein
MENNNMLELGINSEENVLETALGRIQVPPNGIGG